MSKKYGVAKRIGPSIEDQRALTPSKKVATIKKKAGRPTVSPSPPERKHAEKPWNQNRPKKGVQGPGVKSISKIKNFAKLTAAPNPDYSGKTAHFAPGVPNTAAIRKGYTPPGVSSKKIRGGVTDTEGDAPAHTTYDPT